MVPDVVVGVKVLGCAVVPVLVITAVVFVVGGDGDVVLGVVLVGMVSHCLYIVVVVLLWWLIVVFVVFIALYCCCCG